MQQLWRQGVYDHGNAAREVDDVLSMWCHPVTPADEIARLRATVDRKDEQMAVLQDEIDRLRREHDKRLEEYATENAALRDRIKGEHMSYLAECRYKDEIADLAKKLGAEVSTTQRLKAALKEARDAIFYGFDNPLQRAETINRIDAALASGNGDGGNER